MTVFHLCFDLTFYGHLRQNFYDDPFWTWQRTAIVSLFLFCAGMGQALAAAQGQSRTRFWQRWGQIVLCAALVSAGSYLVFPRSFIYFGVLHGIAVMMLIVRATLRTGRWMWLFGAIAIVAPPLGAQLLMQRPAWADTMDARALNWLGLITHKPITEDYVPLLPWLGAMWWGAATAQWLLRRAAGGAWTRALPRPAAPLIWLGRHSLVYYMLHQPVLIGAVLAAGGLLR